MRTALGRWVRAIPVALIALALCMTIATLPARTGADQEQWERVRVGLLSLESPVPGDRAVVALSGRAAEILPQLESDLGARFAARFRMILIPPGAPRDSDLMRLDDSAPP